MPTATRTRRPRQPRPARARRPDVFEDWRAGDGSAALLRYYEVAPRPVAAGEGEASGEPEPPRHVVALYWPFNLDRKQLVWRFATVEEARVGWREARAYLASLGFERLAS
jgi:hypothetical protein